MPSYRAITSSIIVASKTHSGTQDTLRHLPCCARRHGVWFTGHRFPPADFRLRQRRQAACQVQAVHAEGGAGNEDDGGPLEPWHMFAHRQDVRGSSAVMQARQEDVARLAYLAFIPHRGRGGWVRLNSS